MDKQMSSELTTTAIQWDYYQVNIVIDSLYSLAIQLHYLGVRGDWLAAKVSV